MTCSSRRSSGQSHDPLPLPRLPPLIRVGDNARVSPARGGPRGRGDYGGDDVTLQETARKLLSPWAVGDQPMETLPSALRLIADIAAAIRAAEIAALEWAAREMCSGCRGEFGSKPAIIIFGWFHRSGDYAIACSAGAIRSEIERLKEVTP